MIPNAFLYIERLVRLFKDLIHNSREVVMVVSDWVSN